MCVVIEERQYLSDHVDAEVETLEAVHAEEGAGKDLLDEVPAEVQVLQGAQVLQVHVSYRLNTKFYICSC
jgi:hypothetical protein